MPDMIFSHIHANPGNLEFIRRIKNNSALKDVLCVFGVSSDGTQSEREIQLAYKYGADIHLRGSLREFVHNAFLTRYLFGTSLSAYTSGCIYDSPAFHEFETQFNAHGKAAWGPVPPTRKIVRMHDLELKCVVTV